MGRTVSGWGSGGYRKIPIHLERCLHIGNGHYLPSALPPLGPPDCCRQAFMRTWILDAGIRNPGIHFAPSRKHALSGGIEVREDLDGNAERNCLHDLLVFGQLFLRTELVAGGNQRANFRVSGDEIGLVVWPST